ncbi:uncharacterized protein LOC112589778 isoform X3 [Harpegnathos saltator]|uniref:uncharacterized protein LOC112589778 isoform X3 n=1 Tax=Harpegnathos saltator TaxID=610380 RepID=UPI000DBEDAE5|nr:uncharacterized protein LOC112589778 isoform X3 [Harpegnathos saltator]
MKIVCPLQIREIIENIYYDWKFFKNKAELDIMNDYANIAKQFTKMCLLCLCIGIAAIIICYTMPIILDIVSPVNVSRAEDLHFAVEYFVDQSNYALHACALFKVTNYRMESTMDKDVLRIPNPQRQHVIRDRLICAVIIHRRAFLFCDILMQNLQRSLLFLAVIGVVSLSINLFRVSNTIFCTIQFFQNNQVNISLIVRLTS